MYILPLKVADLVMWPTPTQVAMYLMTSVNKVYTVHVGIYAKEHQSDLAY